MNEKLVEILEHYKQTYGLIGSLDEIYKELIDNNVEVKGDSYYCPIWHDDRWVLLAGTKDKADFWVLKKIIKLIKTGDPIISVLNGNSELLLSKLLRYNTEIIEKDGDFVYIAFNIKE